MPSDPSQWEMVDDATANTLRPMTPGQRLLIAFELYELARRTIRTQVEKDHPDWIGEQVAREVARQISQGVVPRGCTAAAWLDRTARADDNASPTADEPLVLFAKG
jgi:Rv0078B-related antitoxin